MGNEQLPFSDLPKGGAIAVSEQLVYCVKTSVVKREKKAFGKTRFPSQNKGDLYTFIPWFRFAISMRHLYTHVDIK